MKTKRVLLIDDNEIDNFINNRIISKSNIAETITVKKSGIEALEYLETLKDDFDSFPDLVFLDIAMPTMNGFDFLNEFIKFPKVLDKLCSVIMLTSSNNQSDRKKAFEYPVVKDYFVKPLKIEMLEVLKEKSL